MADSEASDLQKTEKRHKNVAMSVTSGDISTSLSRSGSKMPSSWCLYCVITHWTLRRVTNQNLKCNFMSN